MLIGRLARNDTFQAGTVDRLAHGVSALLKIDPVAGFVVGVAQQVVKLLPDLHQVEQFCCVPSAANRSKAASTAFIATRNSVTGNNTAA